MESLFVRSLALAAAQDAHCLVSASRTPADGTFAVASATDGVIRVYAASCVAQLHEFAAIHGRIHALHYTSFSDSLVTLESDANGADGDSADEETYLCVYHDWRERKMVRGYTLPLGVLESPASQRKADCVAVCSFTGRVVVAMGTVLNIWQCSAGFFEHVMEVKVDMSQQHEFHSVEYVAIHGLYVAYASQTEVRVMEIHVRSAKDSGGTVPSSSAGNQRVIQAISQVSLDVTNSDDRHVSKHSVLPEDAQDCVHIETLEDLETLAEITVPSAYNRIDSEKPPQQETMFEEQENVPVVMGRNEAQQEAWILAGLVKSQDIRMNRALAYYTNENDVRVLLRRFLPPNHCVASLKFLPETIDNRMSIEARTYTRLLVATERNAFLYYFLSEEADTTRKTMSRKVLGRGEGLRARGQLKPVRVGKLTTSLSRDSFPSMDGEEEDDEESVESGRVVIHYSFPAPVSCITANSSFLFVATYSELQVWSIWSPCHHVAASRALSLALVPRPTQPRLLCTQAIPIAPAEIAALDAYVVLLPVTTSTVEQATPSFVRMASMLAPHLLPEAEFELRGTAQTTKSLHHRALIFQQSPPSLIFSRVREGVFLEQAMTSERIDLLLSLFSLYRYRADVGLDVISARRDAFLHPDAEKTDDKRDMYALELETKLYDTLARECAADLAEMFTSSANRNLARAALLYVASNVPSAKVLERLQSIMDDTNREEVVDATAKYLEAFVFPSVDSPPSLGSKFLDDMTRTRSEDMGDGQGFTRTVLLHYGTHAPEQLARLIVDASLLWTLDDIQFGFNELARSASTSALVQIAQLVLILRASTLPDDEWQRFSESGGDGDDGSQLFADLCTYDEVTKRTKILLQDHPDALLQWCASHPEVLVVRSHSPRELGSSITDRTSSYLAHAVLVESPASFLKILKKIFQTAVSRQEGLLPTLLFCLVAIGDGAESSATRITTKAWKKSTQCGTTLFSFDQVFVVRFLLFMLHALPELEQRAEHSEIHDDDVELRRLKALVAMEYLHLCTKLSACISRSVQKIDERTSSSLIELFTGKLDLAMTNHSSLPDWVHDYIATRCLPEQPELQRVLRYLFLQALVLLHEKDLMSPSDILMCFEVAKSDGTSGRRLQQTSKPSWILDSDLAVLFVLLTLPRATRTVEGFELIGERPKLVSLFLPYGKSFCSTLEEWRYLIKTLSSISDNNDEVCERNDTSDQHDEIVVLERVLKHICSTLGPEDLLQVLPDEGDLALFIATLETSVRLDVAVTKGKANDEEENLFADPTPFAP